MRDIVVLREYGLGGCRRHVVGLGRYRLSSALRRVCFVDLGALQQEVWMDGLLFANTRSLSWVNNINSTQGDSFYKPLASISLGFKLLLARVG